MGSVTTKAQTFTYSSLLRDGEHRLSEHHVSPEDAVLLLAHASQRAITDILAHPAEGVPPSISKQFQEYIDQRSRGYSVATIRGYTDFYGLRFKVTEDTLIPRPESELLVERALDFLKDKKKVPILDMGTGCGNLIIAIAKNTSPQQLQYYACDISPAALDVAKQNARTHKVSIHFENSNLFSHIPQLKFACILANLPYLSTDQLKEPSIRREPIGALWGGSAGTDLYQVFLQQTPQFLAATGLLLLEIDPRQTDVLMAQAIQQFPDASVSCIKDLAGHDRMIVIDRSL